MARRHPPTSPRIASPSNQEWAREVMYRTIHSMLETLGPQALDALEISGETWGQRLAFRSYRSANFPAFDICKQRLPESFDLIIADQVFEHLLWPYRAANNVRSMLRSGGRFLLTTPFLIRVHDTPFDCSRWTETGLRYFLAECGFDLQRILTGSWGNRSCVVANFEAWPIYRPSVHSLANEPEFPVVVWAMAQV
jgi:hypothetical protein